MLYGTQWWQVLLAVLVYFGLGAAWYSPALFAKIWTQELGKKAGEMGDAQKAMIATFLAMVLLALIEAYIIDMTGTHGALQGAYLGLKLWLGFVFTTGLVNSVFQGSSKKLFAIDQGYHLAGMVLAGAILAL